MLVILTVGAFYDLKNHKIPNWWILSASMVGLLLLCWLQTETGAQGLKLCSHFLLRGIGVIALFFPLYYCRMLGAGDIKLMAVICGFLGLLQGGTVIFTGFLIGAVLALIKLLIQRSLIQRLTYLYAYFRRMFLTKEVMAYHRPDRDGYRHTIPMGLCLFLGALTGVMIH